MTANESTPLNREDNAVTGVSYQTINGDSTANDSAGDEENRPVLQATSSVQLQTSVWTIVSVLSVGEFISNADGTLVMATAGGISSEFDRLQDASWLATAYTLGVCAAQPMYGRLSDIYGRKALLLLAYVLFAVGCVISGIGYAMWMVILGRAISGIGGAGIMTVGSIIITDIVPKREVASWRAYINIFMTLGRSMGGPVGGWLADAIGWRWLFLSQVPLVITGIIFTITKLNIVYHDKRKASLRRVDFLGTGLLAASIVAAIVLLDRAGHAFPWLSLPSFLFGGLAIVLLAVFIVVEKYIAAEPIFDLSILRRPNVLPSYLIASVQIMAQVGMMFTVPLYFQVTQRASATVAGGHLVPAVIGNTIGGLIAGTLIRRTGQYKIFVVVAGMVASITYILQLLLWNGQTNWWESLYILPGGMGTGIASAAAFVSMTALLEPEEIAMATGGYMLLFSFAMTAGVTTMNTFLGMEFKRQMQRNLHGPGADEIIKRAMSDTRYISDLTGRVRETVVRCYVAGLKDTYLISLGCSVLGSLIGLTMRHHRL